jgi:hypothetical protein
MFGFEHLAKGRPGTAALSAVNNMIIVSRYNELSALKGTTCGKLLLLLTNL